MTAPLSGKKLARSLLASVGLDGKLETAFSYSNQVFLAPHAVVRMNDRPHLANLGREQLVLSQLGNEVAHPRVIAYGVHEKTEWIISERLDGRSLTNSWGALSTDERRRTCVELGRQTKALHAHSIDEVESAPVWKRNRVRLDFTDPGRALLATADELGDAIPRDVRQQLERLAIRSSEWGPTRVGLVHGDLHFDNVLLVNGAPVIIDYEATGMMPVEFEIEWLMQFCFWPKRFVAEEMEDVVDASDFTDVITWFAEGYPDLFEAPMLRERLQLYMSWQLLEQQLTSGSNEKWPLSVLPDVLAGRGPLALLDAVLPR